MLELLLFSFYSITLKEKEMSVIITHDEATVKDVEWYQRSDIRHTKRSEEYIAFVRRTGGKRYIIIYLFHSIPELKTKRRNQSNFFTTEESERE